MENSVGKGRRVDYNLLTPTTVFLKIRGNICKYMTHFGV